MILLTRVMELLLSLRDRKAIALWIYKRLINQRLFILSSLVDKTTNAYRLKKNLAGEREEVCLNDG